VRISDDDVEISAIYKWYIEDFGGNRWGVLAHLRKFAAPELRERLGFVESIDGYRYDWSLNDEPAPAGQSIASEPNRPAH
jgi:hypothetical protein